jgi:hypothetical protein
LFGAGGVFGDVGANGVSGVRGEGDGRVGGDVDARLVDATCGCPTPPALPRGGVRRRVAVHDASVDDYYAQLRRRPRFYGSAGRGAAGPT